MIKPAHESYQAAVREWCVACFGEKVADDIATRCWRFFEEAGELCQSLGMTKEDAMRLVEYTWGRPEGEPRQELGGVMVTLAALATPAELQMDQAGTIELQRCWLNIEKIREKQKSKAKLGLGSSPLPGSADIGKHVTLQMAVQVGLDHWLPQQTTWQIISEENGNWIAQIVNDERNSSGDYFALPKLLCSAPRW